MGSFEMVSSIRIKGSAKEVWEVFSEVQGWPEWSKVCLDVWGLSEDLWNIDSCLSFRLRMGGVGIPFSVRVIESDLPHRLAWISTKWTVTATRTFTFQEEGNDTLILDHKLFSHPFLPLRLFYPKGIIRRMTDTWLLDLKTEVERRFK